MPEKKENHSSTGKDTVLTPVDNTTKNKPLDKKIHDMMGPIFESLNIKDAIVIAKAPDSDSLEIYYRGHFYDVAVLVAEVHRKFKDQIVEDIN